MTDDLSSNTLSKSMKIHAFSIVKNESDVIEQTLVRATNWCDYIYVFDNGSTDGTWEIVLGLAEQYEEIIAYKQCDCPFDDGLRGEIFNFYRKKITAGDWCCRLDADEVYVDNPREFLRQVHTPYEVVVAAMFVYYFTEKDLENYQKDPSKYENSVPLEKRLNYYQNSEAEIRFFKYREDLVWKEKRDCLIPSDYKDWPAGLKGAGYPTRIKLRNYRYRSPEQIQRRIDTRLSSVKAGKFPQEMPYRWQSLRSTLSQRSDFSQWQSRVACSRKLDFDSGDSDLVLRESLMLDIREILIGYNIVLTPKNVLRELARKVKRNLVKVGITKRNL